MDPLGSTDADEGSEMTIGQLLAAFTIGTGLLAVWAYLRWPNAGPATLKGAILRVLLALLLLQLGLVTLELGVGASPALAITVVVGTIVPVLTYAFLASLWFMKLCADQMRGAL
jgi:hypothetical protein